MRKVHKCKENLRRFCGEKCINTMKITKKCAGVLTSKTQKWIRCQHHSKYSNRLNDHWFLNSEIFIYNVDTLFCHLDCQLLRLNLTNKLLNVHFDSIWSYLIFDYLMDEYVFSFSNQTSIFCLWIIWRMPSRLLSC